MKKTISLLLCMALILSFALMAVSAEEPKTAEVTKPAAVPFNGTLQFGDIRNMVLSKNPTALGLQETIDMLDEIDYEDLKEDLRNALNGLAEAEWMLSELAGTPYGDSYALNNVMSQYDSLKDQFDDISSGKMQSDNADTKRMLKNTQNQLVIAAESLFLASKGLEITDKNLVRQREALERTLSEMQVRYSYGQVTKLNVDQVENGIGQLESGRVTLNMNAEILALQLKNLLGLELDRSMALGELTPVTADELDAMNLEKDLSTAKENSLELYNAKNTLDDAEKDYKDAINKYGYYSEEQAMNRAKHSWNTAQYTYQNSVAAFELNFTTLYLKVQDYAQVLENKKATQKLKEAALDAAKIKYSYGTISKNEVLTAQDELESAKSDVNSALIDLATSYVTYMHAVTDGILN